jgi:hypothetical protein
MNKVILDPRFAFQAVYKNCDLTLRDDCNKTTLLSIEYAHELEFVRFYDVNDYSVFS